MDDKTQGTTDEMKGKARQAYGDLTDDDQAKAKGQSEETKGHAEKAVGDVKDAVSDLTGNS